MRKRCSKKVLRDEHGTSAIEFALIAPVLALLTVGMVDLAGGISRKYELEQASYRALELLTAGSIQTDYSFLKPEAATTAGEPESNVTIDNWLECNGVRKPNFNDTCASSEQVGRYVTVKIVGYYEPFFRYGPLSERAKTSANGQYLLVATSTARVQ